ncbi:MAG: CU044_2847 family protein [Spirillospora sp.]
MGERTTIVEAELPDGSIINAEVALDDTIMDVGLLDRLRLDETTHSFEAFARWAVDRVRAAVRDPENAGREVAPDGMTLGRVGVEFGVKLALKSGKLTSVVAEAGAEANALIRLEWERDPSRRG